MFVLVRACAHPRTLRPTEAGDGKALGGTFFTIPLYRTKNRVLFRRKPRNVSTFDKNGWRLRDDTRISVVGA